MAAPLLVVWLASRARVGLRSAWTAAWLAVVLVVLAWIPATVAGAGAVAALRAASGWLTADGELATLTVALLAAALLSGTGPSGAVVTVLAALPVALVPLGSRFAGGGDLQAAAGATACAAVAAWRPCVAWAAELVGARDPRTTLPDAVDPLV